MAWAALLLVSLLTLASAAEWSYSTNWTADFATCGGQSQSPINIDTDTTIPADFSTLSFSMGYRILQTGSLENNGHTLKFTVDESKGASISGGPLTGRYTLAQFHLHWGSMTGQGSEHTLNGRSYDGELHLVHYNNKFEDLGAAAASGESDALAVVGIFLDEETPWDQHRGAPGYESLQSLKMASKKLSHSWRGPEAPKVEMEIVLEQLMGSITDLTGMYHYKGSLTTPGCNELVMWLVMDTPMHVRDHGLMEALRKNLVDIAGDPIQDNYRPTQEVNDRSVYYYSGARNEVSYVLVPTALNASLGECDVILSAEECWYAASQFLNTSELANGVETQDRDDEPPGCYLYEAGGTEVWYNYNMTGNVTRDSPGYRRQYTPICYENPDHDNYHGYELVQNDFVDCELISFSECQDFADSLALNLTEVGIPNYVPGCAYEDGYAYYNNDTAATGACYWKWICVCAKT